MFKIVDVAPWNPADKSVQIEANQAELAVLLKYVLDIP